ncbi:hypothetical protein FOMG_17244 [Fusarium oxysporum f. sp. melonis 26406]|uniref:Uncharacterized protein n=1 Tax=Fusarium oxysporum f. sp. melonis 26406 TaxID=1089452 RepID=W9ZC32_FUSOX|nr:hypothetical protein FOMG_17244 [Fusarium oxysporum f. sp. melonis 26406]
MATLFPSLAAETVSVRPCSGCSAGVNVSSQVKFANKKAMPFLVFNTLHRAMTTLSQIDHSIEIYLNQLNDMKIFPNRKTVKISGRTVSKKVTDTFYAAKADSGDQVGEVYQAANKHPLQKQPVSVINWSYWLNNANANPNNPIILFYIIQKGVKTIDPAFTNLFHDIRPLFIKPTARDYNDMPGWTSISLRSPPCQKDRYVNPPIPALPSVLQCASHREGVQAL